MESEAKYPDLLEPGLNTPRVKVRKKKKKAKGVAKAGTHHGINVHVNVVNTAGDTKKSKNPADEALDRLRGY